MTFGAALRRATEDFCSLSDEQIARMERHYRLLASWNRRLNLTSVIEMDAAVVKHYAESLFLGIHLPSDCRRVADIGSGAGFPGFPIAVLLPEIQMTLIESDTRKSVFLRESSDGVPNVRVISQRAEQLSEKFDCLVTRAVNTELTSGLIPKLAPKIYALASRSTWNTIARLPWDSDSAVVFHRNTRDTL